ncbi:hypothetical protein MGWOODY_Clf2246 [hydrothermal vent metagenome]|uniref:Uncharacterized protein n=1 Tax=hydrothermal vent metagenome TaxID=652676 RepID=A0A160VCF6_9ZZZZ
MQPEGFFVPENVVPKVRVELTQGHPYRFVLIGGDLHFIDVVNQDTRFQVNLTCKNGLNPIQPLVSVITGLKGWGRGNETCSHIDPAAVFYVDKRTVVRS